MKQGRSNLAVENTLLENKSNRGQGAKRSYEAGEVKLCGLEIHCYKMRATWAREWRV